MAKIRQKNVYAEKSGLKYFGADPNIVIFGEICKHCAR